MIKIKKDLTKIPLLLQRAEVKTAFEQNIQVEAFEHGTNRYKDGDVKSDLEKIYHNKCAYCESKLYATWGDIRTLSTKEKANQQRHPTRMRLLLVGL